MFVKTATKLQLVQDPSVAPLISKLICWCISLFVLSFIAFIVSMAEKQYFGVVNIIVPLAIAACGYSGAKQRNRQCICCMCGWSLVVAIISFIVGIFLVAGYEIVEKSVLEDGNNCYYLTPNGSINPTNVGCLCCQDTVLETFTKSDFDCNNGECQPPSGCFFLQESSSRTSKYVPYSNPDTNAQCTDNLNGVLDAVHSLITVAAVTFIIACVYCCGFCVGCKLNQHPFYNVQTTSQAAQYVTMGDQYTAPVPVQGQAVPVQGVVVQSNPGY